MILLILRPTEANNKEVSATFYCHFVPKSYCTLSNSYLFIVIIVIIYTFGNHDPEGGLKIRKIYKTLGMSSNPYSHDLANSHSKLKRTALKRCTKISISETSNWFRGFLPKCQSIFGQGMKGAGELKRLVLPSSRRQWKQTYIDHLNPRISLLCGMQRVRPGITSSS